MTGGYSRSRSRSVQPWVRVNGKHACTLPKIPSKAHDCIGPHEERHSRRDQALPRTEISEIRPRK